MYLRKHSRVTEGYKKMILGFVIVTVLLVLIVLYFSASKAIIKITPQATAVQTNFVTDVVTDGGSGNAMQGILSEVTVEGTLEGQATGAKALTGGTIGNVTIYNKRAENQTLVKITRLLTPDKILLRLSNQVTVPAGGQIEADVYADDPSAFTELQPTTFILPGLWEGLQDQVYAESKSVLKSSGESIKVIKAVDIARTKDELTNNLYNQAIQEFKTQLPNGEYTALVVSRSVLEEAISDEAETEKDNFTVKLKIKAILLALSQKDIMAVANERLEQVVPDGKQLLNLDFSRFAYTVQNYDEQTGSVNLKVHAEGEAAIQADNDLLAKNKLIGLSPKGVELYLANYDEIESVEVELSPFWVKKIPSLQSHIEIVIDSLE